MRFGEIRSLLHSGNPEEWGFWHTFFSYAPFDENEKGYIMDIFARESRFYNLSEVLVSESSEVDLELFSSFPSLRGLNILHSRIKNLDSLSQFKDLFVLGLVGCGLENVDVVGDLAKLRSLDLSRNEIKNISFIKKNALMDTLCLTGNKITDVSPIRENRNISVLWLDRNPVVNLYNMLRPFTFLSLVDVSVSIGELEYFYNNCRKVECY